MCVAVVCRARPLGGVLGPLHPAWVYRSCCGLITQRLHEERTPFCIAALAAVVFVFTPHLFTLAVTISFVLLASLFYPSRIVISLWKNKADRKMLLEDTEMLIIYYY